MLKNLETSLAWLWGLGVLASVLDQVGVLQFANRSVASGVHWAVLVLAWPAARHWHALRPLPWLLWGSLLGAVLLWGVSVFLSVFGYFTQLPGKYAYALLLDGGDDAIWRWENTRVEWQRGRALVVYQSFASMPNFGGGGDAREVQLVPLTPLWHWVRSVPSPAPTPAARAAQGWVRIDREWPDFSFDPAEQARLDVARARREAEYQRARQLYDADPANQGMAEAVARDAANNRMLDSLRAIERLGEEED